MGLTKADKSELCEVVKEALNYYKVNARKYLLDNGYSEQVYNPTIQKMERLIKKLKGENK